MAERCRIGGGNVLVTDPGPTEARNSPSGSTMYRAARKARGRSAAAAARKRSATVTLTAKSGGGPSVAVGAEAHP